MKLLWKLQLDNQPRQMHNLFPPLIVGDVTTARRRRRRSAIVAGDLRQHLRHRRRHGHADLEAQVRQHVRRADRRARALHAVSGRADGDAGDRARPTPPASTSSTRSRGTAGCGSWTSPPARSRAGGAVPAAQRQAVRAEPARQRALHDDRAGLRRQPEPVLFLRSGDEEGRQLRSRQRRHVAAARAVHRQGRHACTPAAATATTTPSGRSTARPSSRRSRTRRPRRWR